MVAHKLSPVLFSSDKQSWGTPRDFYRWLDAAIGGFTIDVCADSSNAKCRRFFSKEDDGLTQSWAGERWFCNPEYEHAEEWSWKGRYEGERGAPGKLLVPSRVDTKWWRQAIGEDGELGRLKASCYVRETRTWWLRWAAARVGIYHHDERLVFEGGPKDGAPFPSSVLIYLPNGFRPRPLKNRFSYLDGRPPLTAGAPA